jgi:hypothetical protein
MKLEEMQTGEGSKFAERASLLRSQAEKAGFKLDQVIWPLRTRCNAQSEMRSSSRSAQAMLCKIRKRWRGRQSPGAYSPNHLPHQR